MKLTIKNFKSIKLLNEFDIKPFTVISGVNSSGKSSFIQLLLLLKQTVELDSSKQPLSLNGALYNVGNYQDILFNKETENKLKVTFSFERQEFGNIKFENALFSSYDYEYEVEVVFGTFNGVPRVDKLRANIKLPENTGLENQYIHLTREQGNSYFNVDTNTAIFGTELWKDDLKKANVDFLAFFPLSFENSEERGATKHFFSIEAIKKKIQIVFQETSYIGPLRKEPADIYRGSLAAENVGKEGEFVAQILQENGSKGVEFYAIAEHENGIEYNIKSSTLTQAVKYWMCDVFDVAEDIYTEKINDSYSIILTNKSGLNTSIKHVGFGISQLLPIIVEGLTMPTNGILIIEQPEVHLHPKVQSWLFDFLYSLTLQGKTVIVETHSSHLITRMRRRIAEDMSDEMDDRINLTFIENNVFRTIQLDDYGVLDYFPKDFIEPSSKELRAAVKAQMNKRIKNQSQ